MTTYDFDTEIDRQDTNSCKWSIMQDENDAHLSVHTDIFFGENRVLPMWVADMDFVCPQPVIDALIARAQHGIFGYPAITDSFFESAINWIKKRQGWTVDREWIVNTSGVVPAIKTAIRTFVEPGDKVLLQMPVYYPFFPSIMDNGAEIAANPLRYENGRYTMDFDDLEQKTRDPRVTMAILCSPHNPIGRVWTREELLRFGEICLANDVLVVSDELHGDLLFNGAEFTPFAALSESFAQNSIVCTAPSKTFNLAGLHASNIIIPNPRLRQEFQKTVDASGMGGLNLFSVVAMEAAYTHGAEWLDQLLVYIQENYNFLTEFIAKNIPQISVVPLEGTYLVWLDCRELGLEPKALRHLMFHEAGVYLDEGYIFGSDGEGFERVNIACPRSILADALTRIKKAVESMSQSDRFASNNQLANYKPVLSSRKELP